VLSVTALLVWIANPFAALALLPAFHLWLLVTASPVPAPRATGVALVMAGLLIPALVVIAALARLSLGPLGGAWYAFLLVTGHQIGLYTALVLALLAACFVAALRIVLARRVGAEAGRRR
jgi:malonyl CoA-acyl carrier protein transacylase